MQNVLGYKEDVVDLIGQVRRWLGEDRRFVIADHMFTPNQVAEIREAVMMDLFRNPMNEDIRRHLKTRHLFSHLACDEWISDEVMNSALEQFLEEELECRDPSFQQVFEPISSLCLSVNSGGISEHFEKNRLYEGNILFPVNIANVHWCGIVADRWKRTVYLYDPLMRDSYRSKLLQLWTRFIVPRFPGGSEFKIVAVKPFTKTCTSLGDFAEKQRDGHNCGMYVLHYFHSILHEHVHRVDTQHMPLLRLWYIHKLLGHRLYFLSGMLRRYNTIVLSWLSSPCGMAKQRELTSSRLRGTIRVVANLLENIPSRARWIARWINSKVGLIARDDK
ncbi:SWIM-type domain-containing protein [Plasmodiophora brassicae]